MPRIVLTAQVKDATQWLKTFPTHGDLFRQHRATVIHYTANDQNEVAPYEEVEDLEWFFKQMQTPATGAAMAADGVTPGQREGVRLGPGVARLIERASGARMPARRPARSSI